MTKDQLREYVVEVLNSILEEDPLQEFSGAEAAGGFSLPLGMSPGVPPTPYVKSSRKSLTKKKKKRHK
jgi:hypothetical protein